MLRGRSATSLCPGIWKQSVDGPTMVRRRNIDGDGQGGLNGHGGEQRAVLVYQLESYRHWQQHFGRDGALSWWILIPAVTSTVAWPFVAWLLRRVRVQLAVE